MTVQQYYNKVAGCPARLATDPECICWHDEGSGPYKGPRNDNARMTWRDKPNANQLAKSPGMADADIDAIVFRQTGFDGDGVQAMNIGDIRRVVRAAMAVACAGRVELSDAQCKAVINAYNATIQSITATKRGLTIEYDDCAAYRAIREALES